MTAKHDSQAKIACNHATIIIRNDTTFDIEDQFCTFAGFYVPSTKDLDTIKAILDQPDWTELQINEAVEALQED